LQNLEEEEALIKAEMENDPPVEDADGTDFGEIFGN